MDSFTLTQQPSSEQPSAPANRVDRAAERIKTCADEMGISISPNELDRFVLVYLGMQDDARELAKKTLGGQFVPPKT